MNIPPQTIELEYQLLFNRVGVDTVTPVITGQTVESVAQAYRQARRKRAVVDRPTGHRWRAVLTSYGRERCKESPACAERHSSLTLNKWITVGN